MKITGTKYSIEHIPGEDNVWADIVSRWGQQPATDKTSIKHVHTKSMRVVSILRPLQDDAFVWPSTADIRAYQQRFKSSAPLRHTIDSDVVMVSGKIWIPRHAHDLLKGIFVVARCGVVCHRGDQVMVDYLKGRFMIDKLQSKAAAFVRACLLCKHVKGGQLVQRAWTTTRQATHRNEFFHLDFLFLGDSYGATKYILVLKDELSHCCEHVPCDEPTSTAAAIIGCHFKNTLVEELRQCLKVQHLFVPVYSPWINGTVERVNRDVLQVLRVLLLELKLDTRNWLYLLPIVQPNLSHSPVESLANRAPIELFTGLDRSSPLNSIVIL